MFEAIRRVGVDHESDIRILASNRSYDLNIFTRLDFELNSLVSGPQSAVNLRQKCRTRGLDSDGNATRDLLPGSAQQLRKGNPFLLRFDVPHPVLHPSLRHLVPADRIKQTRVRRSAATAPPDTEG